jgi:mycofactocin system transcriptional regulator
VGRPVVTTPGEIEQAAFRLFAAAGFEGTTMAAIAAEVGVGQRTLFRYYPSKNDIPWGQFDRTLDAFRDLLDAQPSSLSLLEAVGRGVVAFNDFPSDASPPHAVRMRLILTTPALRAHSALKYDEWRAVVAEYVARRLDCQPVDLRPQLLGHVALGIALAAYDQWLRSGREDNLSVLELLREAVAAMVGSQCGQ